MNFKDLNSSNYPLLLKHYTDNKQDISAIDTLDYIIALNNNIEINYGKLPNAIIGIAKSDKVFDINTSPTMVNSLLTTVLTFVNYSDSNTISMDTFNNKFDSLDVEYFINNKEDDNTPYTTKVMIPSDATYYSTNITSRLVEKLGYDNTVKVLNLVMHICRKLKYL